MPIKNTMTLVLCLMTICLTAQSSFDIALAHLQQNEKYVAADLADLIISDEYQSRHNGMTHLYLIQRHQGIAIKHAVTNFNIKDGELRHAAGNFVANINEKINATTTSIKASQALGKVMAKHSIEGAIPAIKNIERGKDLKTTFEKGTIALQDIVLKLVYWEKEDQLVLSWEVSLYEKAGAHWWKTYVDGQTGEILAENDQVIHCSFHPEGEKRTIKSKVKHLAEITLKKNATLMANSYRVYAAPVESPNHGSRTLETSPWTLAGDAGDLGWHDDGTDTYTHTRGNNVDAYADHDNSNEATGGNDSRADGGANLEFDFNIDLTLYPDEVPDPFITNLFYWNNIIHDIWYQYGFDEVSGNFQNDNQGRGGEEGDYVRAEAQDGGGINNANFATPADGSSGRMQMYLWDTGNDNQQELTVNAPVNVAGSYEMERATFGDPLFNSVTGDVEEVDDGTGNASLGCEALVNDLTGKIALIDRGTCQFGTKSLNAQNAGAIAVIICNNNNSDPFRMSGGDDGDMVTIPAVMISQSDCTTIRAELNDGLNVELTRGDVEVDGDLDNAIIAHEYGHGISNRLTGGPSMDDCLNNQEQMGEGWSDFLGIWMTIESGDSHTDGRGVGTYAIGQDVDGDGIRPAPYTTDMSVNGYTYGNVDDSGISRPHGIGFIWCTMLWDLNWAMVNAHGLDLDMYNGTGGNNITAQLVMDGMKGQPCRPGFVDGRDAILQADVDNNGGANQAIIWNVFARRGLGDSADQGSSNNRSDQTEAFDLPDGIDFMTEEELFDLAPLPVELLAFHAVPNHKKQAIELHWSTASETDNRGFDLQRRTAEEDQFETIAWIDGQLDYDGLSTYAHTDESVKGAINYYYRLRQVDLNGKENFSPIVNAKLRGLAAAINIYPNPTEDISLIQFSTEIKGAVHLEILNAQGQIIGLQIFETNGGAELEVSLANQPEGVYFFKIKIAEEHFIKRVVLKR